MGIFALTKCYKSYTTLNTSYDLYICQDGYQMSSLASSLSSLRAWCCPIVRSNFQPQVQVTQRMLQREQSMANGENTSSSDSIFSLSNATACDIPPNNISFRGRHLGLLSSPQCHFHHKLFEVIMPTPQNLLLSSSQDQDMSFLMTRPFIY